MKSNLDNEIEIWNHVPWWKVRQWESCLNTTLIIAGKISDREIYGDTPISVNFMDKSNDFYQSSNSLFTEISPTTLN
jgi:hypothetical protein